MDQILTGRIEGIDHLTIYEADLGRDIKFIGLSAEPVAAWGEDFRRYAGKGKLIFPLGCIGTTYGYLPTKKMLSEGGYETEGFFKIFGYRPSEFKKNIREVLFN